MSLADYVFSLKAIVGTNILVEAVGIGTGKQDLTGMAFEPSRANQVIPMRPEIPTEKVTKTFVDEKMSLADHVFPLKAIVGTNILVEAVAIGTGKQDLTGMAFEPSRAN